MKVIVAGLFKTGTKSLKSALETLGYEVWDVPEQLNFVNGGMHAWEEVLLEQNGEKSKQMLQSMFSNCDTVTDGPASVMSVDLACAFPKSKVILCVRDNEELWFKSYQKNIANLNKNMILRVLYWVSPTIHRRYKIIETVNNAVSCGKFVSPVLQMFSQTLSPVLCKRAYLAHIDHVMASVESSRLIKFNVKEGWGPLCDFLGKDIPTEPFPHANRAAYNATSAGLYDYVRNNSIKEVREKVAIEIFLAFTTIFILGLSLTVVFNLV